MGFYFKRPHVFKAITTTTLIVQIRVSYCSLRTDHYLESYKLLVLETDISNILTSIGYKNIKWGNLEYRKKKVWW